MRASLRGAGTGTERDAAARRVVPRSGCAARRPATRQSVGAGGEGEQERMLRTGGGEGEGATLRIVRDVGRRRGSPRVARIVLGNREQVTNDARATRLGADDRPFLLVAEPPAAKDRTAQILRHGARRGGSIAGGRGPRGVRRHRVGAG